MIKIITDRRKGEPEILSSYSNLNLMIKDTDGRLLFISEPPIGGWTTDLLSSAVLHDDIVHLAQYMALDAFLGEQWVGSTEV